MKKAFCAECGCELSSDEVALSQRMLGMHIARFFCLSCLAGKLRTTPTHLQTLVARFKEMGCAYFTRLMEDSSDEKTNDNL